VDIIPVYKEVRNDIGGEVAFDMSYQGEHAIISVDLNRWNEPVYSMVAARPGLGYSAAGRGTNVLGDVGTLVLTEGLGLTVWLLFQFGTSGGAPKIAMNSGGMPPGYRFLATVPFGPDRLSPLGTRPRKVNLTFAAIRAWNPASQTFTLYDHVVGGLPVPN
jgi:hypothetical protein